MAAQTSTKVHAAPDNSFMNESVDYPEQATATETTKEQSGVNSHPASHRHRELKDKSQEQSRNGLHFKGADILYSDLLSEETILSPNYRPPQNPL